MKILKPIVFLFTIIPLIYSIDINCPISSCGSDVSIQYPFKLESQQPRICNKFINLKCIPENNIVLNLPFSGDFYVHDILYYEQSVALYDPENCLPKRLMNLNLSSSPFSAIKLQKYTFYICPSTAELVSKGFVPIDCLSNSTNATVASSTASPAYMAQSFGCIVLTTLEIPVSSYGGDFDGYGIYGNVKLTWNFPDCEDCEDSNTDESNKWTKFAKSPFYLPTFVVAPLFLGFCSAIIMKFRNSRNAMNSDSPNVGTLPESAPRSIAGGLDESKINACTELVVLTEGSRPPDCSNTCSICLESYCPQDIVRNIAKCEHCFHAHCIELWLKKNSTCPVCRTIVAGVDK